MSLAVATALALPAAAQSSPSPLDAGHSYASLWMGRQTEVTVMVNVAVAQVGGAVNLSVQNPVASAFDFTLVPGGEGADLLAPDGTLRTDVIARILRYTAMTFRSDRARIRQDGRLEFPGELTVLHVTREQLPIIWNSANNFPSYTDPQTSRVTRRVTFVLATPRAEFLASYLQKQSELLLSATIDSDTFPELPGVVLDSNWPTVAQDEYCAPVTTSFGARDYNGVTCSGKAISVVPSLQRLQTFSVDFAGLRKHNAPTNGPVTILLHLKLASPASSTSAPPGR